MSKSKMVMIGLLLVGLLVALALWQKDQPQGMATAVPNKTVSLMPYSSDWKLADNEEALLVFVYLPGTEVAEEQLQQFNEAKATFKGKVKFATLNLTLQHPSYSNAAYAEVFAVRESPTFILQRKGESSYHKHSGQMTEAELLAFVNNGLTTTPPKR